MSSREDLDAAGFGYWPQEAQDAILRREAEIQRLRDEYRYWQNRAHAAERGDRNRMSSDANSHRLYDQREAERMAEEVVALLAENQRLHEEIRIREESQIPVIPRGAKQQMDHLEAESQRLRDALDCLLPANGCHTVEEALAAFAPMDGTPSAAEHDMVDGPLGHPESGE